MRDEATYLWEFALSISQGRMFNSMRRTWIHRTVRWTYRMSQIMTLQQSHNFDPVTFLQLPDNQRPARLASRRVLAAVEQGHTAWCGGSACEHLVQ